MNNTDERTFLEQLDTALSGFDLARTDGSVVVTSVTTMVHRRMKELEDAESTPKPPLTTEQFDALTRYVEHVAWVAAGAATHQPRATDDWPEQNAREALTGANP
jgi:hypothetical protein